MMKSQIPLLLILTACQAQGPELLVVVGSDLEVPSALNTLYAGISEDAADAPDGDRWERIGLGSGNPLPLSFVVRPGHGGPLGIYLDARINDQSVVRRQVLINVPEQGTIFVPMYLASRCRNLSCAPGQTCNEQGCVDPSQVPMREVEIGKELEGLCTPGQSQCSFDGHTRSSCPSFGEPQLQETCTGDTICRPASGTCEAGGGKLTVSVSKNGPGAGNVVSQPAGLNCGPTCSVQVAPNTLLRLTVEPELGSTFGAWHGACEGKPNPCEVMVSSDLTISVDLQNAGGPNLNVVLSGSGRGRVTSGDSRIDCGTNCNANYTQAAPVHLVATAQLGSRFVGWLGACSGTGTICDLNVASPMQVEARFEPAGTPAEAPYDLDGDGHSDLIFAAPRRDTPATEAGRVYVTFGPPPNAMSGAELAPLRYDGPSIGARFGESIAFAADLTGDGEPDLVVGAPGHNGGKGAVFVIPGGPSLVRGLNGGMPTNALTISGDTLGSGFGVAVNTSADLDKDGKPDLVVGAPGAGPVLGRVYVFYTGGGLTVTTAAAASMILTAEGPDDHFGASVAGVPDLDADGFDDLLVGAPDYGGGTQTGRAYLFAGGGAFGERGASSATMTIRGANGARLGTAVTGLSDFDGDGKGDFALGAPGSNQVYLFFTIGSGVFNTGDAQRILSGVGNFGTSLSGLDDYDGDGFPDLVVGSPEDGGPTAGAVAIFPGRNPSATAQYRVIGDCAEQGTCAGEGFGGSVGPAGDLDADGILDLAVGSRFGGGSAGPPGRGRITVHHFGSGVSSEQYSDDAFVKVVGEPEAQGACGTVLGSRPF